MLLPLPYTLICPRLLCELPLSLQNYLGLASPLESSLITPRSPEDIIPLSSPTTVLSRRYSNNSLVCLPYFSSENLQQLAQSLAHNRIQHIVLNRLSLGCTEILLSVQLSSGLKKVLKLSSYEPATFVKIKNSNRVLGHPSATSSVIVPKP